MQNLISPMIVCLFLLIGIGPGACEGIRFTTACTGDASHIALNDTIRMKIGYAYCHPGKDIRLVCDSLIGDSRCPVNVVCIWAGKAELSFVLVQEKDTFSFSLNSNNSFQTDSVINGLRYQLLDLLPYPEIPLERELDDYTVLFKITRVEY